jgi:hypothetical protein
VFELNFLQNSAVAASGPAPAPAVVLAYSPIFTTATNQQAPSPGVLYTGQETQLPIMPMEDDDFSDHESVLGLNSLAPFIDSVRDLIGFFLPHRRA